MPQHETIPKTALAFLWILASPHVMGSKHRQGNHPSLNPNTPAAGTHEEAAQNTSSSKTYFGYFRQGDALLNAHRKAATTTLPPRLQGMQRISQLFSLLWGSSQLFLAQLTANVKGASKKGQYKTIEDGGSSNSLGSSLAQGTALLSPHLCPTSTVWTKQDVPKNTPSSLSWGWGAREEEDKAMTLPIPVLPIKVSPKITAGTWPCLPGTQSSVKHLPQVLKLVGWELQMLCLAGASQNLKPQLSGGDWRATETLQTGEKEFQGYHSCNNCTLENFLTPPNSQLSIGWKGLSEQKPHSFQVEK